MFHCSTNRTMKPPCRVRGFSIWSLPWMWECHLASPGGQRACIDDQGVTVRPPSDPQPFLRRPREISEKPRQVALFRLRLETYKLSIFQRSSSSTSGIRKVEIISEPAISLINSKFPHLPSKSCKAHQTRTKEEHCCGYGDGVRVFKWCINKKMDFNKIVLV